MRSFIILMLLCCSFAAYSQNNHITPVNKNDYQIFLKQPAKEIKLLMYEKNFVPIQGILSEDRKSIIMKDYENGNKVYVKVIYEDGSEEEFTKSPCYIDPVIS